MVGIFQSATNGVLTADIEWVTETFILVPPVQYIHIEDCRDCRWWLSNSWQVAQSRGLGLISDDSQPVTLVYQFCISYYHS